MCFFDRQKFAEKRVVLGVADRWIVEDLITVIVFFDRGSERRNTFAEVHPSPPQEKRRRASAPPAGRPFAAIIDWQ
jgi:hypothetical protein